MPRTEKQNSNYKNLDNDSRGLWRSDNLLASLTGGQRGAQFAKSGVSKDIYDVIGLPEKYLDRVLVQAGEFLKKNLKH